MPFSNYQEFSFESEGEVRSVYWRGPAAGVALGPGVIVMHELPGMTEETFELGDRIAAAGYTVFLPLLFGEPNQKGAHVRMFRQVCVQKEFNCWRAGRSSPITDWLRALCREVHGRCSGSGVGAIGMCFTGGFALSMMVEPSLMAPVVSQPSLPFRAIWSGSLDTSPEELEQAKERAIPVLGFRFQKDPICPGRRFDRLQREFGEGFQRHDLPSWRPGRHSVLTYEFRKGAPGTREAFDRLVAFLDERLRG